ncbi:MAG: hypothetical protein IKA57_03840 [Clostridia bacterium]|nr:hypothetical protein [Clostridia bacterium]
MGKKKSIVLMVLLTIVIVVLCAITVVPTFTIPFTNGVKIWNPVVKQYDLGADLDGGYYAYYYPTGVISETEWKNLDGEDQKDYNAYKGLYLSNDPDLGIITEDGNVSKDFQENFQKATAEITARYAAKGYSDYRISVVDDYALAIRIPASEKTEQQTAFQNAYTTFGLFAETGALEIKKGDALVDERLEYEVDEIIKEFSVYTKYEVAYVQVKFTDVGKEMIKSYKDSGSEDKLTILLGDQNIMEINAAEHITTKNVVRYPIAMETEVGYVETMVILLNSVLENGSFDIEFNSVSNSEVRSYSALDGENTLLLIYIALAIILVGLMVCSVWKMGGFGVSNVYSTVSYLIVTAICYAFISGGVFEITFGSILVFVVGLVLTNVLNLHIYGAIRSEAMLGKTIESSVKGGYRKTIMTVVDVYAVLTLGAVALLIGVAGVNTFALQALICIVTAAFCNLLWTRVINVMLLSASKDKYKYFGLVREDDDDE